MGTGTILVIGGLLLVIGWLVWNNPLVKGGVKMVSDPRFKQLIEDRVKIAHYFLRDFETTRKYKTKEKNLVYKDHF